MKIMKLMTILLLFGLYPINSIHAQDPMKAAPNVYKKILIDNDKVRVMQVEFGVGDVAPWHRHPDHIAYALTDGKIEITDKGKAAVVYDIKAGDAMFLTAVTHMAKNIGTAPIKMIVTEIKPASPKKMKTK